MKLNTKWFYAFKYILLFSLILYLGVVVFLDFDIEVRRVLMDIEKSDDVSQDFILGVKALSSSLVPLRLKVFTIALVLVVISLASFPKGKN